MSAGSQLANGPTSSAERAKEDGSQLCTTSVLDRKYPELPSKAVTNRRICDVVLWTSVAQYEMAVPHSALVLSRVR